MSYNGHKSRNAWNVSLWIYNDAGLYRRAVRLCRSFKRDEAARRLMEDLPATTPDGAPYAFTSVRAALVGI